MENMKEEKIVPNFKYIKTHEWSEKLADGSIRVGITHHAQSLLGKVIYVQLPSINLFFSAKDECAVIESVKAAADAYAPVSGEIIAVNGTLEHHPESVNHAPYSQGWLFIIEPKNGTEGGGITLFRRI